MFRFFIALLVPIMCIVYFVDKAVLPACNMDIDTHLCTTTRVFLINLYARYLTTNFRTSLDKWT